MEVFYRSDLYVAGRTEDGELVHGQAFYVVAELEDGRRFAHGYTFTDTTLVEFEDEDGWGGFGFDVDTAAAEAKAAALVERIKAFGKIDISRWREISPCYGSAAYQQQEFDIVARERELERTGGF